MNDRPNIPEGFIPIEPDEATHNFQKNIDPSVIQPNFDYKKFEQDARRQIDSLLTFEDRVKYANKGSVLKTIITGVVVGLILLVVEYHKAILDFILSLIP